MGDAVVGVVANPLSSRDIRRLVTQASVAEIAPIHPGSVHRVQAQAGVIAVDGERELTFSPSEHVEVRLRADGPRCVDVPAVLAVSARLGLLRRARP